MKGITVLVLGLAAIAMAKEIGDQVIVKGDVKEKQTFILKLLNHVMEPCMYNDIVDLGKNFNIEENVDLFTRSDVVKRFAKMLKFGLLPRGEVFTIHIDRQLDEVVTMFHVLYYAKDFDAFIKTASWMRLYMNEGMFVYALTVACRHREDCNGIILPPPYEIYPYYFVHTDVIQKAYMLKMRKGLLDPKLCDFYGIKKTDKDVYVIDENYFDTRAYLNDEDKLRYFTEDIDLNTYYYYFHIDNPFWMKDNMFGKYNIRRGELTLYVYQQILARYYLERLSNGLGVTHTLSFDRPIRKGYWPWMILHNGVELARRMNNYVINRDDNVRVLQVVEVYENIISEILAKGQIDVNGMILKLTKPEDVEILGKLIYGTIDRGTNTDLSKASVHALRYMLILMKACIGLDTLKSDKYFVMPTVLDQYQTALRDPVFYMLQQRLMNMIIGFKRRLPSYTKEQLLFPGVKIDNVVVDKLVTYFDHYLMDMTNAVTLNEEELKKGKSDIVVMVRKRRLNHQPFKVTIDVSSDKTVDSVVRIFLGPKQDQLDRLLDVNRNRFNFVELDSFLYKLTSGKNTIVRDSKDMHNLVSDRVLTRDIWQKIESGSNLSDLMGKDLKNYMTGFPTRLLLPKGYVGGMEMMLYCIITPLQLVENVDMEMLENNRMDFRSTVLLDKMPLGFPLDRYIDVTQFYTPNMKFVDVMVFHKRMSCDMKTRWNKWVLKHYDMAEFSPIESDTYFVNSDINTHFNVDMNVDVEL